MVGYDQNIQSHMERTILDVAIFYYIDLTPNNLCRMTGTSWCARLYRYPVPFDQHSRILQLNYLHIDDEGEGEGHPILTLTPYFVDGSDVRSKRSGKTIYYDMWSSINSTIPVSTSTTSPLPDVYTGTICGLMTNTGHGCDSVKPNGACPTDYIKNSWDIGNTGSGIISFCSKITTNKNTGPAGTICGMATGTAVSLCGGRNPYSEPCPVGYEPYAWLVNWGSGSMNWCYKTMQETKDLSGTMCGMQTGGTGPTCNGYYPSRGSCPPGYHLAQWLVSFGTGVWSFCIKD